MTDVWWNLSGTDKKCDSYGGGHWVHWIQHKLSVRNPGPVILVHATADEHGAVQLTGDGLSLQMWNHRPALVHCAGALGRNRAAEAAPASPGGADRRCGRWSEQRIQPRGSQREARMPPDPRHQPDRLTPDVNSTAQTSPDRLDTVKLIERADLDGDTGRRSSPRRSYAQQSDPIQRTTRRQHHDGAGGTCPCHGARTHESGPSGLAEVTASCRRWHGDMTDIADQR